MSNNEDNNKPKPSVILARVSSKAQEAEGYSLDSQEKLLTEYNLRLGFNVAEVFKIAESASKVTQRKIFHEMMKYVRKEKIHIITVEKVDRFVRNFKDVVLTDEWLEEDDKNQVHFVKDGIVLHKNSKSTEKLNWGIRVVISKNYIDNLKEEILKGQLEKLAQGWTPGRPPAGYKTVGEAGKTIHVIDEAKARLIIMIFKKYLEADQNLNTLTKYAETIGLTSSLGHAYVRSHIAENILKNKFYIGINTWSGKEYPGAQETFMSKELFEAVQAKMSGKAPMLQSKHNPDLKGVFYCSNCNHLITWEQHRGKWYGHCNRSYTNSCPVRPWARQDEVEAQLLDYFSNITCPDPKLGQWAIVELKKRLKQDDYDNTGLVKQLGSEQNRLKRQLEILYEDRLAERISTDYYDSKRNEIETKIADLSKKVVNADMSSSNSLSKGIKILETSQMAHESYGKMSSDTKKSLLRDIFSTRYINSKLIEVKYSREAEFVAAKVAKHKEMVKYSRTSKFTPINRGNRCMTPYFGVVGGRGGT